MSIPLDRHPDTWEHLVEQMTEALREAMNDATRNKRRYIVVQGKQHTHSGESYYTFTLEDDWEPSANTNVQIAIDSDDSGKMIAGTILSSTNNQITLVTETPLPQASLKKVTICEATAWLLEKLCDALIRLQGQGEASIDMAAKTFGLFPSYAGRGERQVSMSSFMSDLDQERAITLGMESERLFLIGPPGTGKTSTEAALALEFLHSHKTVLLVAHTNVALDTAIKRLQQYCEQSGNTHHLKQHHILRIGASKELVGERYHDVTLQGIVDQKLGNLAQERDQLQQEQSNLQNALTHLARGLASQQQQWRNQRLDLEAQLTTAQQTYTLLQTCEQRRHSARVTRLEAIQKERQVQQKKQKEAGQVIQASKAALLASKARRAACEQELQIKRQELVKNP